MSDCISEDDRNISEILMDDESDDNEDIINNNVNFVCDESSPIKPTGKGRKQRNARTKLPQSESQSSSSTPSTPSKHHQLQQHQQQASVSLLEYVVDQKGVGSESLVVKSASIVGSSSVSSGSRRNSILGVSPKKTLNNSTNNFSQFNPNYTTTTTPSFNSNSNSTSIQTPTTTQSHPLFPNYPRVNYNLTSNSTGPNNFNHLPSLETQFDFNLLNGGDLGLTALNVNDFNLLGIWNNGIPISNTITNNHNININSNNNNTNNNISGSNYFNIYAQSSETPRYSQHHHHQSPQITTNQLLPSSTSQNPINNLVSDLFNDISGMF